jgi:hypothetical protein
VNSDKSIFRNIDWRRLIIFAVGGLLLLLGAGRFVLRNNFGFMYVLYCCLAVIPAGLVLLVIAYVVQHAILVSVIPLFLAGLLAASSPVFDVALGLALMGIVAESALSEWKSEKRVRKSTTAHDAEKNSINAIDDT